MCSRYGALKLGTRVCALYCHLPVSPGAHEWGIQVTQAIVPAHHLFPRPSTIQLAAHAKGSTLYRRPYGHKFKFFRLDGLLLFCIIMGYAARAASAASSAIIIVRYYFLCSASKVTYTLAKICKRYYNLDKFAEKHKP